MDKISFKSYNNMLQRQSQFPNIGFNIITQVTNNGDKALSQWKPILRDFPDSLGGDFVQVGCFLHENPNQPVRFILNNKPLRFENSSMPAFTQVAKLLSQICTTPESEFKTQFPQNTDCIKSLCRLFTPNKLTGLSAKEIQMIKDNEQIQHAASFMNEKLYTQMIEYFA